MSWKRARPLALLLAVACGGGDRSEPAPAGGGGGPGPPYEGPLEGTVYQGDVSSQPYRIDLGTVLVAGGKLRATVSAVEGSDCVYDYLELVDSQGVALRVEAEDPNHTRGADGSTDVHAPDHRWWLQSFGPFSGGRGLVALKSEKPPPLVTETEVGPGEYKVSLGSFTGDPSNGAFAVRVQVTAE